MQHNYDLAPDPEDAAAQAFSRSETHTFRGQLLLPYSFRRQAARARLGLTMRSAADSAYFIFLCLTPDEEVTALWGESAIHAWRAKAEAWAEKQSISEALGAEINPIAAAVLADVHASDFRVQSKGGTGGSAHPKARGRRTKPNTSKPSRRSRTAR